jgi:hypothetical protein
VAVKEQLKDVTMVTSLDLLLDVMMVQPTEESTESMLE